MILSPAFIYWEGREWDNDDDNDDVYIKYYEMMIMKDAFRSMFLYENYIQHWWFTRYSLVFLLPVCTFPNKQNQWCFVEQKTVGASSY